jgi:sulfur-oxidizing protein SoxA
MKGVASRYPAFDESLKRPITLSQRINQCRQKNQQAEPLRLESQDLLSLESFVAHQSRGMPVAPPDDKRLDTYRQRGQQRSTQRMGQLNLSCAQCHDDNAGGRLGSSQIPQAHPTGYPVYRLEWQNLGSLQRRLRNCMSGVRAEPFAYGSPELVELELHLAVRAKGMLVETPGVRP